jgi:hypothetical protein
MSMVNKKSEGKQFGHVIHQTNQVNLLKMLDFYYNLITLILYLLEEECLSLCGFFPSAV